jgi:outer membrane lipoprotein-sorting protein
MKGNKIYSGKISVKGMFRGLLLSVLILSGPEATPAAAQDNAKEILASMDKVLFAPKDKEMDIQMVMTDMMTKKEKIKKARIYQKGADKKLFVYTYPQSDKGIATLTLPGEMYLYLPMFKKPKKITNMAEGNSMNKSDFSLEDMPSKPYGERFTPKLLETTASSWVLELIPKDDKPTYSKLVVTINKAHHYPEKIEYYDQKIRHYLQVLS